MSNEGKVSVELPGVDFAALARQVIALEVSKALSLPKEAVNNLVAAAMQEKVDEQGKPSRYGDGKTFIEWAARSAIRDAVLDVIKTRVESMRPKIAELIEAQLRKNAKAMSVIFTDGFLAQAARANAYNFKLSITLNEEQ